MCCEVQTECERIPQNARRDVASAANSDHEVGLELIKDLVSCLLAELVDLWRVYVSVWLEPGT